MPALSVADAVRTHLVLHQRQFSQSIDPRVTQRHGNAVFDAIATRAEFLTALLRPDAVYEAEAELTLLAGAAHMSLVADVMPVGDPMKRTYEVVSVDIVKAMLGLAELPDSPEDGLETFADSITDHVMTAELDQAVREWGPGSLLHNIRKHLGVTPGSETSFRITIIDADDHLTEIMPTRQTYDNETRLRRFFPGGTPAAWVSHFDDSPTIYLRRSTAGKLSRSLGDNALFMNEVDTVLINHEYTHTQRNLTIRDRPGFGLTFNEVLASDAGVLLTPERPHRPRIHYSDAGRFLDVVSLMTNESIKLSIQRAGRSNNVDMLYRTVAGEVGLTGMALLACHRPANYCHSNNFVIPGAYSPQAERTIIDTILTQRTLAHGRHEVRATIQRNMIDYFQSHAGVLDNDHFDETMDYRLPEVFDKSFLAARDQQTFAVPLADAIVRMLRVTPAGVAALSVS